MRRFFFLAFWAHLFLSQVSGYCQAGNGGAYTLSRHDTADIIDRSRKQVEFVMGNAANLASTPGPKSAIFKKQDDKRKAQTVLKILGEFADSSENTIGITHRTGNPTTLPVNKYFRHLMQLDQQYAVIECTVADVYIGEVQQVAGFADSFVVIATFIQTFHGINSKKETLDYHSITKKKITLHIKREEIWGSDEKGKSIKKNAWLVKLGDIEVVEEIKNQ